MKLTDRSDQLTRGGEHAAPPGTARGALARHRILQGAREVLGSEGLAACSLAAVALGATLGAGLEPPELEARARAMITSIYGHIELWLCSGGGDPARYREGAIREARAIAVEGIEGI